MPVPPLRPAALHQKVFRGSWAVRTGVLTAASLRSSAWRPVRRDVYVDATVPDSHVLRATAVGLCMPPGAALAGRTAAVLWGVTDLVRTDDPVEVAVPVGIRWTPGPDVVASSSDLTGATTRQDGRVLTTRLRTAVDLARRAGLLTERVVLVDRLVRARVVDLPTLRDAVVALPRCRGSAHAREAVALADGLAESPQETRTRLVLRAAGVPPPVAQFVVRRDGRFVARVDFAWPARRLALEYDGLWHGDARQFARDRARLNALLAAGWRVLFVTARDLHHPEELAARVCEALAA